MALEPGRLQRYEAQLAAYEAALVVQLADTADGSPEAEEFFVDEPAVTLGTSVTSAGATWVPSERLVRRLPGTWAAPADGEPATRHDRAAERAGRASGAGPDPPPFRAVRRSV